MDLELLKPRWGIFTLVWFYLYELTICFSNQKQRTQKKPDILITLIWLQQKHHKTTEAPHEKNERHFNL